MSEQMGRVRITRSKENPTSFRLSALTRRQMDILRERWNVGLGEVLTLCVDRAFQAESFTQQGEEGER